MYPIIKEKIVDIYLVGCLKLLICKEKFEDTKVVIRRRKSKRDRQPNDNKGQRDKQHNHQKNKDKRKNNDIQNITQKTNDRATGTPLNTRG